MKKIISVFTALIVLAVFLCPCIALAADPTFEVSSATAAVDEEAKITISIKNNPGITSAKIKVKFDSALTLKSAAFGDEFKANTMMSNELKSPFTFNWASGLTEFKGDAVFATLTFAANSKAKSKDYKISVSYDKEDVFNLKEENIKFATVDGKITVTGAPEEVVTADGASNPADADVTVVPEEDGNIVGGEVAFDEEGNVIEDSQGEESDTSGKIVFWIGIAAAAVIVVMAIITYLNTKKETAQNKTEEPKEAEE